MAYPDLTSAIAYISQLTTQCNVTGRSSELTDREILLDIILALNEDGYSVNKYGWGLFEMSRSVRRLTISESSIIDIVIVVICITCSALASGLMQGLLSLDLMEMQIKSRSGTDREKAVVGHLIPIISRHHLLLVTMLLWNACANEALPIFLAHLVPEYVSIIISVTLVLFVGEIMPASVMTGPRHLEFTAALVPLAYSIITIFSPLAYPISLVLDCVVGRNDVTLHKRTEISAMVQLQGEEGKRRKRMRGRRLSDAENMFEDDELATISGALKYGQTLVYSIMTPIENAFMISAADVLNYKLLYRIFTEGYSRIPVYGRNRNDIVGIIVAKELIFIDPKDETPVKSFLNVFGRNPIFVWKGDRLSETLAMFLRTHTRIAIVQNSKYPNNGNGAVDTVNVGIITLEDIIEEILGADIEDDEAAATEAEQNYLERDAELAKWRTIDSIGVSTGEGGLSEQELHAVSEYLRANVSQFARIFKDSNEDDILQYLRRCHVIEMTRKPKSTEDRTEQQRCNDDCLYQRGRPSNSCVLILNGTIEVFENDCVSRFLGIQSYPFHVSGRIEGPWTVLAPEVLEIPEGTYVPCFSAIVHSEKVRFLRLTNPLKRKAERPAHDQMKYSGVSSGYDGYVRQENEETEKIHHFDANLQTDTDIGTAADTDTEDRDRIRNDVETGATDTDSVRNPLLL